MGVVDQAAKQGTEEDIASLCSSFWYMTVMGMLIMFYLRGI